MISRTHLTVPHDFATKLLAWFDEHGRHGLPWQINRTAYRVWVSEIMLQQTQVATVIPYFNKFMEQFPNMTALAAAPVDDVLALWTGLGYYSRARHLHQCAQWVAQHWQGEFLTTVDDLVQLPGIGRSTAAAIISQAFNQPAAILDGNVKRVLARFYGIEGWPGLAHIEKALWQKAEQLTPTHRNADYTQAIMDLGATICKRNKPLCVACPMQEACTAFAQDNTTNLPTRKPKKAVPTKHIWALLISNHKHQIQLHQRPSQGIWGGLWSLLEFATQQDLKHHVAKQVLPNHPVGYKTSYSNKSTAYNTTPLQTLPAINHAFSHYKLIIHPMHLALSRSQQVAYESLSMQVPAGSYNWFDDDSAKKIGLPGPIKKLLYRHWDL